MSTTGSSNFPTQCSHCGAFHLGICPKIKSIEYNENGTIKKIEYKDGSEKSVDSWWTTKEHK